MADMNRRIREAVSARRLSIPARKGREGGQEEKTRGPRSAMNEAIRRASGRGPADERAADGTGGGP